MRSSAWQACTLLGLPASLPWAFDKNAIFHLEDLPLFIGLGLVMGLVSVYFTKVYITLEDWCEGLKKPYLRILVGGVSLGLLVLVLPFLYGEGYSIINDCLHGHTDFLFRNAMYADFPHHPAIVIILLLILVLFKPVAASLTFGGGGVGGIFAPSLFVGAVAGLLFAYIINQIGVFGEVSLQQFALVGMAGVMSVSELLETDFLTLSPQQTLGDLVKKITISQRNIFPVLILGSDVTQGQFF